MRFVRVFPALLFAAAALAQPALILAPMRAVNGGARRHSGCRRTHGGEWNPLREFGLWAHAGTAGQPADGFLGGRKMRTLLLACLAMAASAQPHTAWKDYAGAADSAQYSALQQVNRSNVARLDVAWTYAIGD